MSGNQFSSVHKDDNAHSLKDAPQDTTDVPPLQPVAASPKRGRPSLNRTPEEKREMRRIYMQKYRNLKRSTL